jgi:hypothetical protein
LIEIDRNSTEIDQKITEIDQKITEMTKIDRKLTENGLNKKIERKPNQNEAKMSKYEQKRDINS